MLTVSYSGLGLYENCPSAFNRRYILKEEVHPQGKEQHPAAQRGSAIHRGIELFLLGESDELPEDVEFYADFFAGIRNQNTIKPEHRWAFTEGWEPTTFGSKDAMIRGVVDCVLQDGNTCHVYEFKTGKRYADHVQQRALYGMAALLDHPMVDEAIVSTMYLDQRKHEAVTFKKDMLRSYKWLWDTRIAKVQPPQEYPERPNWKCKYCPYSNLHGGTCSY